jgi:anti-anti-sigma factor
MKIDTSLHDDYAVLTLKGEFDTFYVPRFQEEVGGLVDRGITHVVLNLRLVSFINSTALGAIIKLHKRCKAEAGDLVLCRASPIVKDIVHKLGIDQLVPIYDEDEAAVKHMIKSLNAREATREATLDEEKVLVSFPDEVRNRQVGGARTLIGRMSNVDGQRVQFLFSARRQGMSAEAALPLFFRGSELLLRFQVKLFKKTYFDVTAVVDEVESTRDGELKIRASFRKIEPSDRAALTQFAADMEFLKRQLPG